MVCAHLVRDLTDFSRAIAIEDFERGLARLGVGVAAKGKADNQPIVLLSADDLPVGLPPFVVNLAGMEMIWLTPSGARDRPTAPGAKWYSG